MEASRSCRDDSKVLFLAVIVIDIRPEDVEASSSVSDNSKTCFLFITDVKIRPANKPIRFPASAQCGGSARKLTDGTCNRNFVQRGCRSRSGFLSKGNHSGGIQQRIDATPGPVAVDQCTAAHEGEECKVTWGTAVIPHR